MSDKLPPGPVFDPNDPPAPPSLASQAQRVIFCANDPLTCLQLAIPKLTDAQIAALYTVPLTLKLQHDWTAALTADPAYVEGATPAIVADLRSVGFRVVSWCDCDATPASAAIELMQRLGLDGWIGQAETPQQLYNAERAGAKVIIGNPNAWSASDRAFVKASVEFGSLAIIGEMYRPDAGYSAQGVPIASFCYGIDIGGGVYTPLADYLAVSPPGSAAACCIYHAAGMRDADWRLLA